jgi:hypothetical protein
MFDRAVGEVDFDGLRDLYSPARASATAPAGVLHG